MDIDQLNNQFAIANQLDFFTSEEGVTMARINNQQAEASIALQGAQVLHYQKKGDAHPLLWVSNEGKAKPGKAARGGIPVCWPWFGTHHQEGFPAHGYARTAEWQVTGSHSSNQQETTITLALIDNESFNSLWPHKAKLTLTVTVGETLRLSLETTNLDEQAIEITEALHTYFNISQIEQISVSGLEQHHYYNKVADERGVLTDAIHFDQEYDRVFFDHATSCQIVDPGMERRIVISKQGSHSTIVWNPWTEKAKSLGDIAAMDWQQMVCVESGNAMDNRITLQAGETHQLEVSYATEKTGAV